MKTIEQSIEVDAPIQTVYNQWTQFEEFPEFMGGVESVRQLDDKRLHWVATIGGARYEWDAEIYEQVPDQRIAWRSISGKTNDGSVTFEKIGNERTRVRAIVGYKPEGATEKLADAVGILSSRIKGDLNRFKQFVESRGVETGGWRGEIHGAEVSRENEPRSKRLHGGTGPTGSSQGGI